MIDGIDINAEQVKGVWRGLTAIMAVPVTKQCYALKKKPDAIESGCGRHLIQWSRGSGANRINRIIFLYNSDMVRLIFRRTRDL